MFVAPSCPTLCNPMDCSLTGSSVHGILQAIVLEWTAISFSRGIFPTQGSNPGLPHCRQTLYCLSHLKQGLIFSCLIKNIGNISFLLLSIGFPRQESWSGLPLPSLGGLSDLGIQPRSPGLHGAAGRFFTIERLGKPSV